MNGLLTTTDDAEAVADKRVSPLARSIELIAGLENENATLLAENKRLREALEKIAADDIDHLPHGDYNFGPLHTALEAQTIARTALKGDTP